MTLYFPAFISLIFPEMFPFHKEILISLAWWSSVQKVLCPNLMQWPHKVSQDLNHLWKVLSLLLLKVLSAVSPVFLSPTLHIFITLYITQPQTLFAELNWNPIDFYSVIHNKSLVRNKPVLTLTLLVTWCLSLHSGMGTSWIYEMCHNCRQHTTTATHVLHCFA